MAGLCTDSIMLKDAFSAYARRIGQGSRLNTTIVLENHTPSTVYTTGSSLSGSVTLVAPTLTPFDAVEVSLEGTTSTYMESVSTTSTDTRIMAKHTFLRLAMPIPDSSYPKSRALDAGETLTLPFNFVVPERLLPTACAHPTCGDHVQDAHLRLPPSMGDTQNECLDDLAPDMTKVRYMVMARVLRRRRGDSEKMVLSESSTALTVMPTYTENPPLSIGRHDKDYNLSQSKELRRGVFSGRLGTITLSAPQPSSVSPVTQPTTLTTLHVRFDPAAPGVQPPRLGNLATKLKAETFFSLHPVSSLPTRSSLAMLSLAHRGTYSYSVPLSSRKVGAVEWKRQECTPAYERRDSGYESRSSASTSSTSLRTIESKRELGSPSVFNTLNPNIATADHYYTATIILPITLPPSKGWLPTFHSCLVSRTYTLDCSLAVHVPGLGMPASNLVLTLPLQVASQSATTQVDCTDGQWAIDSILTPTAIGVDSGPATILPQYADLMGLGSRLDVADSTSGAPEV